MDGLRRCSREVDSIQRRLPTFVGNSARALRILSVCVVWHIIFVYMCLTHTYPPSDMRNEHGHIGVRAYFCMYAEHPVRAG